MGATVRLPLPLAQDEEAWVVAPSGAEVPLDRGAADEEGLAPFSATGAAGHYPHPRL